MARRTAVSAAEKFRQLKKFSMGNTRVTIDANGNASMFLFGNRIAFRTTDGRLFITTAGWITSTTFSRLREITNANLSRGRGNATINGQEWDGRWIEIIHADPFVMLNKDVPPIID